MTYVTGLGVVKSYFIWPINSCCFIGASVCVLDTMIFERQVIKIIMTFSVWDLIVKDAASCYLRNEQFKPPPPPPPVSVIYFKGM